MKLNELLNNWRQSLEQPVVEKMIEELEERSAIREFDAGYARLESERLAMEELERRRKSVDADKKVNK